MVCAVFLVFRKKIINTESHFERVVSLCIKFLAKGDKSTVINYVSALNLEKKSLIRYSSILVRTGRQRDFKGLSYTQGMGRFQKIDGFMMISVQSLTTYFQNRKACSHKVIAIVRLCSELIMTPFTFQNLLIL